MKGPKPIPGQPKIPFMVKNLYGLCALSSLLTFPMIGLEYALWHRGELILWHRGLLNHWVDPPAEVISFIGFMIAVGVPFFIGGWRGSRFIVKLTNFYFSAGRHDLAEWALLAFNKNLFYSHFKKAPEIVDFVLENHLETKRDRYAKFLRKMGKLGPGVP